MKIGEYQNRLFEMSKKGLFITFEGSEGCGKSTQIALLRERLESSGRKVEVLREPGGTDMGESIRHLLQHAKEGAAMTSEAELLLFAASRAQLVREKIQPALDAGRVVISDRFLDSTTVYQGVARRIPAQDTAGINAFAVGDCLPDVTFLLDLERETSLARMRAGKRELDRIERESEEFFAAVRSGYLDLAKKNPGRVVVLDASQPVEALAEEIQSLLSQRNEFLF
jgi:dTMP kinase